MIDKDKLIRDLLSNPRIAKLIEDLKPTREQIEQALPIMIDMNEEVDDEKTRFLTSFFITPNGSVQRVEIRSTYWKKYAYLDNVILKDIFPIDFEDNQKFIKDEYRRELTSMLAKYLNSDEFLKGIYLHGSYGIGKTFILKRMAKRIAEHNKKVAFVNVSEFALKIKSTFNTQETYTDIVEDLKNVDYLFFDDIGAEKISSWFRDDFLFSILNTRMQNKRTTFFSSNFNLDKLITIESRTDGSKYLERDRSERLIERIKALSIPFELKGKNKR